VSSARRIPRDQHNISRKNISRPALKVLYRLRDAGHEAYLVGGGVRDLLLESRPKDFDIATDAHPEEVRSAFSNCRLIGRRFRLAHVHFGREIVEVATFRGPSAGAEGDRLVENGRLLRDNVYGTLEEDALRRDFSVNALYYSIDDFSVRDFCGGYEDLRSKRLRMLGNPESRYREDPVRMLRAARFAAKLGFEIDPQTRAPIAGLAHLLESIPPARLFDEVLKLFLGGFAERTLAELEELNLFQILFPQTFRMIAAGGDRQVLMHALRNTDQRIAAGQPVTPAFLFAALLWLPYCKALGHTQTRDLSPVVAMDQAGELVVRTQAKSTAIPRRFTAPMREIWRMQPRFHNRRGKRPLRFLAHRRFRAAYDFLLLRVRESPELEPLAQWWTHLQELEEADRQTWIQQAAQEHSAQPRNKNYRRARKGS